MQALILAGGSGTRFWPLSRRQRPKQLLALEGDRSLLQQTVDRLRPLASPEEVWICTTRSLAGAVGEQLPEVPAGQILAEPEGRNTAAAIGWALVSMPPAARQEIVAVLPADHRVSDPAAFGRTVEAAAKIAADQDRVMTLGVKPRWPETGYGYLEVEDGPAGPAGLRQVKRFTEKPDAETAAGFVADGNYLWNAGIFVFRGATLLELLARHEPEIGRGLAAIEGEPSRLDEIYPRLPSISIDYAVMEKIDDLGTVALDCGWSDLGSWTALAEVLTSDAADNSRHGDVVAVEADGNLLWSETGTLAVLGVSGLVVVQTRDAVLVVPRERAQEVRALVAALAARGSEELL